MSEDDRTSEQKFLDDLADDVMYSPKQTHARLRHAARVALQKAFDAGRAAEREVRVPTGEPAPCST